MRLVLYNHQLQIGRASQTFSGTLNPHANSTLSHLPSSTSLSLTRAQLKHLSHGKKH